MTIYDLAIAWEWQYDADFVRILEAACLDKGLSLLQITPGNLDTILQSLAFNEISFRAFLDRATDTKDQFLRLVDWTRSQPIYRINPYGFARRAWDKAACHFNLTRAGLPTPQTIILPAFRDQPSPTPIDLSSLGDCFAIKPSHGGGGKGVVKQATTWDEVLVARQVYPEDQYLIQAFIHQAVLDSRPAWFRVLYCCDQIYPCWWDTNTHVYTPITPYEEERFQLSPLYRITDKIAQICNLELFSTEIALSPQGEFVVIDYINDPVDLRLQSKAKEGVPDEIIRDITQKITGLVSTRVVPALMMVLAYQ
jgi:hypothetical protein